MKKTRFALFAAAALALVACVQEVQEEKPGTQTVGDNTLSFVIKSGIATRSGETDAPAVTETGISIPVGETPSGEVLSFEETLTSLDGFSQDAPETRGTPVYSQNFDKMSGGSFKGLAFKVAEMNGVQTGAFIPDGNFDLEGDRWSRKFDTDPFGENDQLLFYARMVKNETSDNANGTGVLNSYEYSYRSETGQSFTFSYRSALTAQEMQDIVFAARKIDKAEAQKGSDLLFYHALTGVKFATAQDTEGKVKTFIKEVELSGIYGYGKCTVTSRQENNGYVDDKDVYSSANAISWAPSFGNKRLKETVYSQKFNDETVDYATGGSFGEKGKYADSFAAGGNEKNLNTADGSMTFWLIPQDMTNDVKLTVTYEIEVKGKREEYKQTIDFGKMINEKNGKTITWKAGQLRTFTLKPNEVDIDIHDEVSGYKKDNVQIRNTGNVDAFIRALIVANWWGFAGNEEGVAMGYVDDQGSADVAPWSMSWNATASKYVDNYGGEFDGLPAPGATSDWVRGKDGYFYYTKAVPPGKLTGEPEAAKPLFNEYNLDTQAHPVPQIYYLDGSVKPYTKVYLKMEIPVQAIEAKENEKWDDAWGAVLGTKPVAQ